MISFKYDARCFVFAERESRVESDDYNYNFIYHVTSIVDHELGIPKRKPNSLYAAIDSAITLRISHYGSKIQLYARVVTSYIFL